MKRIIALILCTLLVFPAAAVSATNTATTTNGTNKLVFTDVDAATVQGKAIYKLVENNIVIGYGDNTFKPNGFVTRAELVKMVNLVFKYTQSDLVNFSDVKAEDWFYPYTLVAKKAGYITGYEDGTFRGANNLTRQEACVIISRVGGLYDIPFMQNISDEVADWAVGYVRKVLANRLMTLEEGNKFRATENITRGELALVLSNFIVETPSVNVNPDTSSGVGGSTGGSTGGSIGGSTGGSTGGGGGSGSSSKDDDDDSTYAPDDDDEGTTPGTSTTPDTPSNPSTPTEPDDSDEPDTPIQPDEPDEPDEPELDEEKQNAILEKINDMLYHIRRVRFESTYERPIMNVIQATLQSVVQDANNGVIIYEDDYVKDTYRDDIETAKAMYEALDDTRKSDFESRLLTNFPTATVDELLYIFFDRRLEDFV